MLICGLMVNGLWVLPMYIIQHYRYDVVLCTTAVLLVLLYCY